MLAGLGSEQVVEKGEGRTVSFAVSDQPGLFSLPEMAEVKTLACSRLWWQLCARGKCSPVSPLALPGPGPGWLPLSPAAVGPWGDRTLSVPLRPSDTLRAAPRA